MFYPVKKISVVFLLTLFLVSSLYSELAFKDSSAILSEYNPLLNNNYKQSSIGQLVEDIKEKKTLLLNTNKSNTTQFISLYDEIAELTIFKNEQLLKMDRVDDIDVDKTCDLALKYAEVEFIKTEYYKTPFHDEVAKTLQNITKLYEQCHPPMAEKYLKSIVKIKGHIYLKDSVEVAKAHDALGNYYQVYMADFKKAIGEYEEAKRIREKFYGIKDPRITENYERLAFNLYYHGDKTGEAEKLLLDSINIREKAFPNLDFPLYVAYMDAGIYYSLKGESVKHIYYFKKAKKTFSGEKKSDYKRILRELSISPKN